MARLETTDGGRPRARSNGNGKHDVEALNRRNLLAAMRAFRRGDFDVRLPDDLEGIDGQICQAFNDVVVLAASLGEEATELRKVVGVEGRTKKRMRAGGARGGWGLYVRSVNE